mmetsp:Transcript_25872/g.102027  ORF Transcript_25872/g.102027 Transcript_25872/m.102027 type:complete len:234 (-) Transcript_25872:165-866(-)
MCFLQAPAGLGRKGANTLSRRRVRSMVIMNNAAGRQPVLLVDVMDTLVVDPFTVSMYEHFGFTEHKDFLLAKDPDTWIPFELGNMSENTFWDNFFKDKRKVDVEKFGSYMRETYSWIDGMQDLMSELHSMGVEMHLFTNYPVWWKMVEEELCLSQYAEWSFISCQMHTRKPEPKAFLLAADRLGCMPSDCVLIDDRSSNCSGALDIGYLDALKFQSAKQTRQLLRKYFPTLTE